MSRMIEIDGSMGEGGGQILRTSVALAAILGVPLRIYNIRAKRRNPGLRPQHLNAVRAIAALSQGRLEGDRVGSMEIRFWPGRIRGGSIEVDIGTAGSISLVLQAMLPVMAYAESPVRVRIRGGTDVPMAPPIDYVREVLARLLERLGYRIMVRLYRRGHYPRGGGLVEVEVPDPPRGFRPVSFMDRGRMLGVYGRSHAVRLPAHVAERQARAAVSVIRRRLGVEPVIEVESYRPGEDPHLGPGSGIVVWALFEETVMGGDSLGERGKRAEVVGEEAAMRLVEDIETGASLDRHASDMIPVYLALSGGVARVYGARLTTHTKTVLDLLSIMLDGFQYRILEGGEGLPFKVEVRGVRV